MKPSKSSRASRRRPPSNLYDAVVIGGGAAGVGVAVALKDAGVQNFAVLERFWVGASFDAWPRETRLITPSFPTNSIGMLDLNSIAIGVSPAYSIQAEHPSGRQYAAHLRAVARLFQLPVREKIDVLRITKVGDSFRIDTPEDTLSAKHVIWAGGEFQYPQFGGFRGGEFCRHTATIDAYGKLPGDDFIVIGGAESGIDAAYYLAERGKRVRLFDKGCPWEAHTSEPSAALSTYSLERMQKDAFKKNVELSPFTPIDTVTRGDAGFEVTTADGRTLHTEVAPLLAGGFEGSQRMVADLFEQRDDGFPLLNEQDESTIVPGFFLCGPAVRHGNNIFCFIYKYRQRFAVVANAVAKSLGLPADQLEHYRSWGMYLDDLSCCGEECLC